MYFFRFVVLNYCVVINSPYYAQLRENSLCQPQPRITPLPETKQPGRFYATALLHSRKKQMRASNQTSWMHATGRTDKCGEAIGSCGTGLSV